MSERVTITVPMWALLRDGDGASRGGLSGRIHPTPVQATGMPSA